IRMHLQATSSVPPVSTSCHMAAATVVAAAAESPRKGRRAILDAPMMTAPDLSSLQLEALDALSAARTDSEVEQWRVTWLGRQDGRVTALTRSIREQPPEQRAAFGAAANALKNRLEAALEEKRE